MIRTPAGTSCPASHRRLCPWAEQRNTTSAAARSYESQKRMSVSPSSPPCTSASRLPAFDVLCTKAISTSGWFTSSRISSPAV